MIAINNNKRLEKRINNDFKYVYAVLDKILKLNFYSSKMKQKIIQLKHDLIKKENDIKLKKFNY